MKLVGQCVDDMALIRSDAQYPVTALASRTLGCHVLVVEKGMYDAMLDQPGNMVFVPQHYRASLMVPPAERALAHITIVQELLSITKHTYFQGLPPAVLHDLASQASLLSLTDVDGILCREGDACDRVWIVVKVGGCVGGGWAPLGGARGDNY